MKTTKNIALENTLASSFAARTRNALVRSSAAAFALLAALASSGCGAEIGSVDEDPTLDSEGATDEASLASTSPYDSILSEITGWATGTTGGKDGSVYTVTTLNDSGNGSLRDALENNNTRWIRFSVSGTINLQSSVQLQSNKTVDARGASIRIKTKDQSTTAFRIEHQSNIVLINLEFDNEFADYENDHEGADAVNIVDSHDIWIHHCKFLQWKDGAIDLKETQGGSFVGNNYNVSVTWSHFRKIYQPMLWEGDKLSLGHNVCNNFINARCLKIIGGKAHSFNNFIADWGIAAIQNAKYGGQLYSQRNIFKPDTQHDVNKRDASGDKIENDSHYTIGTVNFLGGSDSVSSSFKTDSINNADEEYCSTTTCWTDMKDRLVDQAGPTL